MVRAHALALPLPLAAAGKIPPVYITVAVKYAAFIRVKLIYALCISMNVCVCVRMCACTGAAEVSTSAGLTLFCC